MNNKLNISTSINKQSSNEGNKRIVIAGGGTGGHIFPAIAIANAIKKIAPLTEILFVGAKGKMEMEKVPQAGYEIKGLDIVGFNRSPLIKNFGLPYKLLKSFFQVKSIFKSFKPTAVIGVGGYSSFPVLRFAQSQKIYSFIHESNSYAGKSNILLGRKATKIFVAGEGMEKFFPAKKIMITGNPVREGISRSNVTREEAINYFGLDSSKKIILSIGGSLGAKSINEAINEHLNQFAENDLQLIWQTGKQFIAKAKEHINDRKDIWAADFITQMDFAYAAADVVISRSGAMAIAELCVVKKPVVFVPFPHAAEDHQTINAKNLVDKKAGLMVKDVDAFKLLVPTIIALLKNEQQQNELVSNISKLVVLHADEVIAKQIIQMISN